MKLLLLLLLTIPTWAASVHVLDASEAGYRVAIHFNVPAGNNSAGFTWKSVALAAGVSGSTVLTEGTGPGQISTVERASVLAGDVIELVATLPLESNGATGVSVDAMVTAAINDYRALLQRRFRYYGFTRP